MERAIGRCTAAVRGVRWLWRVATAVLNAQLGALGGCGDPVDPTRGAEIAAGGAWLTEITAEAGLTFRHESGATGLHLLPEIMGGGVALFDCDEDGDLDVYLVNGNHRLPGARSDRAAVNRLYRQEPGGRFVDVTEASGLGDDGYGMGVAVGDVDNDGHVDVYVSNFGRDRLYRGRGDGTFEDATDAAGLTDEGWSGSVAMLDYDRDGLLDVYVTRYVAFDPEKRCYDQAGRPEYCGPKEYPPVHDLLLHNEGGGVFADVSEAAGIASVAAAGLGVVCDDLDGDGWIDVYVANDAYANQLWINRRDGTFRDEALFLGVALNANAQAEAGMGVVAADLDGDGETDLFLTHLGYETNTLYCSMGSGAGFGDATGRSGLGPSSMPYTGFGVAAIDLEHDGDLDLIVANGRVLRGRLVPGAEVPPPWDLYAEPDLLYLNDGHGRFTPRADLAPGLFARAEITRGIAAGDVDGDGDLDLLVGSIEGPARLYRNDAPKVGRWLRVRAVDPRLRRYAIGARITVACGDRRFHGTVSAGSSYLSAGPAEVHFGLGRVEGYDRIEVVWPDGLH